MAKEFKFSLAQVIVLWAVMAGMLVAIFLVGLWKGREQGVEMALADHGREAVRLPLSMDTTNSSEGNSLGLPITEEPIVDEKVLTKEDKDSRSDDEPKDLAFDFSSNNVELLNDLEKSLGGDNGEASSETGSGETLAEVEKKEAEKPAAVAPALKVNSASAERESATASGEDTSGLNYVDSLKKGWFVQVMAAPSESVAKGVVAQLKTKGYSPSVQKVEVNGKTYRRIFVGPYSSKGVAQINRDKISSYRVSDGEPFLKLSQ